MGGAPSFITITPRRSEFTSLPIQNLLPPPSFFLSSSGASANPFHTLNGPRHRQVGCKNFRAETFDAELSA